MSALFRWVPGRQSSGYHKLLLAQWAPWLDLYLLRYRAGSFVPSHRDPVDGRRHWRLNVVLKQARLGGKFWRDGSDKTGDRIVLFRPDLYTHGVTNVVLGTRYVLSFGLSLPLTPTREADGK